jgi:hypothetical protein
MALDPNPIRLIFIALAFPSQMRVNCWVGMRPHGGRRLIGRQGSKQQSPEKESEEMCRGTASRMRVDGWKR